VAKAYLGKDMETYRRAVNKFYGGDIACPGLLYSPAIGILYPGAADIAYNAGYQLSIFDIGYAMDLTALTAAMVAEAMTPGATKEKILGVLSDIDPQQYFKSRLLGRISYRIYREALYIASEAKKTGSFNEKDAYSRPEIVDTTYQAQLERAFELLDERNQDVPFHAGEIHLINLTALIFTDFNFRKAMEFIINYGRDNDTVAAITGTILGAFHGFQALPEDMRSAVLKTNREVLGIDLEEIAGRLTDQMIQNNAVSID
jgi:ADP-ribosylglycohydrolase